MFKLFYRIFCFCSLTTTTGTILACQVWPSSSRSLLWKSLGMPRSWWTSRTSEVGALSSRTSRGLPRTSGGVPSMAWWQLRSWREPSTNLSLTCTKSLTHMEISRLVVCLSPPPLGLSHAQYGVIYYHDLTMYFALVKALFVCMNL